MTHIKKRVERIKKQEKLKKIQCLKQKTKKITGKPKEEKMAGCPMHDEGVCLLRIAVHLTGCSSQYFEGKACSEDLCPIIYLKKENVI